MTDFISWWNDMCDVSGNWILKNLSGAQVPRGEYYCKMVMQNGGCVNANSWGIIGEFGLDQQMGIDLMRFTAFIEGAALMNGEVWDFVCDELDKEKAADPRFQEEETVNETT